MLLAVWLIRRTQWSPLTPEPIDRTRPAGVMLRDAWRIYLRNRRLLLGIGAVSIPLGLVGTAWAELVLGVTGLGSLLEPEGGGPAIFGGIWFLLLSGGFVTVVPLVLVTTARCPARCCAR